MKIKNLPKTIYLQIGEDCDHDDWNKIYPSHEVTWCEDKINNNDIVYRLDKRRLGEPKARSNGNASYKEKWRAFPGNKPKHETKCLVELHYQSDLGLQKFMWCVYWDGSEFRDYGGNNDIKEGAKVKWFIEEDNLHRPNK